MDRFILDSEIRNITGKSRATIWRWERAGLFPKRRKIGPNRIGWLESEVAAWVASRTASKAEAA